RDRLLRPRSHARLLPAARDRVRRGRRPRRGGDAERPAPHGRRRACHPQLRSGLEAGDREPALARLRLRQPGRGGRALRSDRRRGLRRREGAVERVLGSPLRPAPRSRRRPDRPLRRALNLVAEEVELAAGVRLDILRPPSAEELIDEAAFDDEEFLPYWAELWPSGLALARHVAARELRGLRVL